MMHFKHPMRLLMLRFLSQHRQAIKETYSKHTTVTGYAFIRANKGFELKEAPRFIQREFNKEEFYPILEDDSSKPAIHEGPWIYYEIYWEHDRSTWRFKELYEEGLL